MYPYMVGSGQMGVYKRTFDYTLKTFTVKDPGEMAANCGAAYDREKSTITLSSMGQTLEVRHPGGEIFFSNSEQKPLWPWRLVLLNHLCRADGAALTGTLITYRELENGQVYYPAFRRESILPLAGSLAGESAEKIAKACLELGAVLEKNADVSARFTFLPKFPVTVKIWLKDEEMDGSANILFDASANNFLHTEDIAAVGDLVSYFLIQQYQLMYNTYSECSVLKDRGGLRLEVLYNSSIFCAVKRVHGGGIMAESTLVSTDIEAAARIRADLKSYKIEAAGWEIYRSPGGVHNGGREVGELKGVEAYFQAGGELRRVLGDDGGGWPRELMAECVRGMIQAETFIHAERGYPTPQSYDDYWKEFYKGSCRYYSNLDRIARDWQDYVGGAARQRGLYNKNKSCIIYLRSDGGYTAIGSFIDSFHEIGVCLYLTPDGIIIDCVGTFLRAPDGVCMENERHLQLLLGKKITGLGKKDVAAIAGGSEGCNHLVDILYDLGRAADLAIQRSQQV